MKNSIVDFHQEVNELTLSYFKKLETLKNDFQAKLQKANTNQVADAQSGIKYDMVQKCGDESKVLLIPSHTVEPSTFL